MWHPNPVTQGLLTTMTAHTIDEQVVTFTKGPGMITYSFMMIVALAAIAGVMKAIWPTVPPEAILAGPEAEARAFAGQRRGAIILACVSTLLVFFLTHIRIATFDFAARTLRIEDSRAFVFNTDRTVPFSQIESMRRHKRLLYSYEGWMLRIKLKGGRSLLLGPWAPDPGLLRLIQRVMG